MPMSSETDDWLSPVQILDAADASGLEFDCAFLTGLSDETWPPAVQLSPLVPLKLQRLHEVPGSSPGERSTSNASASLALCFQPRLLWWERTRAASRPPLIDLLKRLQRSFPAGQASCHASRTLLHLSSKSKTPKHRRTSQRNRRRGGTYIIKAQSQCPFRAFAEMRFNAETLEDACFGLDARERGGITP